jgi:hypothetical protein
MTEQVRTLSRDRVVDVVGLVDDATLRDVDVYLRDFLGLCPGAGTHGHLAPVVERAEDAMRPTRGADSTPSTSVRLVRSGRQ